MNNRIEMMRRDLRKKPQVCIETFRIISETYQSMPDEPLVKRRSMAMYNILTKIPIFIREGDLLMGNGASRPNGLEIDIANGMWDQSEIDALREDGYPFDPADEPVLAELNRTVPPFSLNDGMAQVVNDDTYLLPFMKSGLALMRWRSMARGRQNRMCSAQGGLSLTPAQALVCLDYETALHRGVNDMIRECDEELAKIRYITRADYDRQLYLEAMKRCLEGLNIYASRYVALCEQTAETEQDPQRRAELLEIAEICRRVPAEPARTFKEAMQMYWFLFLTVACPNIALGMGRLDQLFYPYYEADLAAGRITREQAVEYFEILRLKDMELGNLNSADHRKESDGEARWHNCVIGGTKKDGSDATNELSYVILEAFQRCPTLHHTVTIRVADSTPMDLIVMGLDCIKRGLSMPAFVSERSYLEYFRRNGVPEEDARDFILTGCLDANLPGKSRTMTCSMFVTPLCLDLFFHGGFDASTGLQVGHDPGPLSQYKTFDEFYAAFKSEFAFYVKLMTERCNLMIISMQENFPEPFKTAFMHNGIKDAVDYQCKQMPYENGGLISPVGMVNLGNSIAAIRKLVFEDRIVTLEELKTAMDANWVGYEALQKACLAVPKYGNDDDFVDQYVADLYQFLEDTTKKLPSASGSHYRCAAVSIFSHAPGGAVTGATPDGRFAGETLADGAISPVGGQDKQGLLALLNSARKIPQDGYQATLFNMKFSPSAMRTTQDLEKLATTIRIYFANGGKQLQFNVCDVETLKDAKVHPEKHADIMVRVAGYSAYFTQLTNRLQDEIIRRTTNEEIA